jgi:hypothetical protein
MMHNGHFIGRANKATRWDEMNCNAQCPSCNLFKSGNVGEYAVRLISKYGKEEFEKLVHRGNSIKKWQVSELEDLIKHYSELVKEQENNHE